MSDPNDTPEPRSLIQRLIDSRAATGPGPVPPPGAGSSASTTDQNNQPPTARNTAC